MGLFMHFAFTQFAKTTVKMNTKRITQQTPPQGVSAERDIPYLNDGNRDHMLDIFYPAGTTAPLPVIFDVHGGGGIIGNKEVNEYFCMSLAKRGFTVVDINYRLMPGSRLQEQIQDVFAALHWVYQNGGSHYCQTNCICITGDSAGGLLVGLAGAINNDDDLAALYGVERVPMPIAAVALNHGLIDPKVGVWRLKAMNAEFERFVYGKKPRQNPVYHKSSLTATAVKGKMPPILVITSKADSLLDKYVNEYVEFLQQNHFEYEVAMPDENEPILEKLGHVFNVGNPEWEASVKMNDRMADFFKRHKL